MKYLFFFLAFILISHASSDSGCPTHVKNCSLCGQGRSSSKCLNCKKPFYNYLGSCYQVCPLGLFADNSSMNCKKKQEDSVYIKAYSASQCLNQCGHKYTDCSCDLMCRRRGDCCSDYKICDIIEENFNASYLDEDEIFEKSLRITDCKFDSFDHKICLQCRDDFYLYNNSCLKECPAKSYIDHINKICKNSRDKCPRGTFLHDTKCVHTCPVGMKANKILFTCENSNRHSFYWIFPSKGSCRGNCGKNVEQMKSDCSCEALCLRQGNCCDDFDSHCPGEVSLNACSKCKSCRDGKCQVCKDNSTPDGIGNCKCNAGFEYDIDSDSCVRKDELETKTMIGVNKFKAKGEKINGVIKQNFEGESILQESHGRSSLSQELFNFPAIFSGFLPVADGMNNHMVGFNGNSTMNVYRGNANLKVITKNEKNINSYNNKKHEVENINSKNLARGDMPGISDIMKELGEDLQLIKIMNKGKSTDNNAIDANNPSNKTETVDYSSLLKENNTEKNIYLHNNILVNDNSVKLLNPDNSNIFSVNKTEEEEEEGEDSEMVNIRSKKKKKSKPASLENDEESDTKPSDSKNQKINTVVVFNTKNSHFNLLGRKKFDSARVNSHGEESQPE